MDDLIERLRGQVFAARTRLTRARKNHIEKAHFFAQSDPALAALLFKKSVRGIALELSSFCNRTCSYCPNHLVDRRSGQIYMDDGVFANLVGALSRIGYARPLALQRYNEPFADRDYTLKRIRQIRDAVPGAAIEIFTNGDYLTHDLLETLHGLGCRKIYATHHFEPGRYSWAEACDQLKHRVELLGFEYSPPTELPYALTYELRVGEGIKVEFAIYNFFGSDSNGQAFGSDRGQVLDIPTDYRRTSPCLRQFDELQIEYTGNLVPCCHIRSDAAAHSGFVLGRITADNDVFLEWANMNFAAWRRSMVGFDEKASPCTTCSYKPIDESPRLRRWEASVRKLAPLEPQ